MEIFSKDILADAQILWDYHVISNELHPSDFLLCLGSSDIRVAAAAADLVTQGIAPLLVISGGLGKVTKTGDGEPEAMRFAREAQRLGVPRSKILLEDKASNTGENFTNTRDLFAAYGVKVTTGTFVTKPYMKRRALATAQAQWPEIMWYPYAPQLSFETYPNREITTRQMIELMVGDLQRFEIYARKGFQVAQSVPANVLNAYERLVANGFDRYVIR